LAEDKKPWYEDIKDRMDGLGRQLENLDTRETILQKDFAKLQEKVEWVIKLREENKEEKKGESQKLRWIVGIGLSVAFSLIGVLLELWRMIPK